METKELIKSSIKTSQQTIEALPQRAKESFSSEKAKKLFNQKLGRIAAAGAITATALTGPNPFTSHEQPHPQNPVITQPTERVDIFPAQSETHASADSISNQSEKQAHIAEQQRKEAQLKAEQQRKEAEQKKREQEKAAQSSDSKLVDALANKAESPTNKKELKTNLANIVESLKEEKIATPRVIAYAMATMETETGHTYAPVREAYYMDEANGEAPGTNGQRTAIANGYSGGKDYYGRGYIQITHDYNYEKFDKKLDMNGKLANNPDEALKPEVAGDILAAFFKENGVAQKAEQDFVAARQPVNGTDKAQEIATDANKYLQAIKTS